MTFTSNSPLTPDAANTLVLQSHRLPLPHPWLEPALASVQSWARASGFTYRFIDDELFGALSDTERELCKAQPVVASDLARLRWCQQLLKEGATRVVWCDADTLVTDPGALRLRSAGCAFGRELWLQSANAKTARLKIYKKIHNAFMQFDAGDPVLDFYAYAAERLIRNHALHSERPMVAQLAGPKFLTHLHNVVAFEVIEAAQVLSPPLAKALLTNDEPVLKQYASAALEPPAAFNLCCSEVQRESLSDDELSAVIRRLQENQSVFTYLR